MRSFLRDLFQDPQRNYKVILIDEDGTDPPRHHHIRPQHLFTMWASSMVGLVLVVVLLLSFTPLRTFIPGYDSEEARQQARMNALRLEALQDSLHLQQQHQVHLQRLMTGEVDSALLAADAEHQEGAEREEEYPAVFPDAQSDNWEDHEQPAFSMSRMPVYSPRLTTPPENGAREPSSVRFPVMPPVEGFITRGFDAQRGHYAIDIAVPEGTPVRSIGSGYVIMADWTQEGGYSIAVQHADGLVSVYKHNSRLLNRVGDRVDERETIAMSGDSGDLSTGPHLHVELWRNGLAQDPEQYFVTP